MRAFCLCLPLYTLQDYRKAIVPAVTSNWCELSIPEQERMLTMNHFFCGLHYIVGLAEQAQACLSTWEKTAIVNDNTHSFQRDSEPGTVRLVRTACKALEAHCNEQSGNHMQFKAYLEAAGISSIPLARFVGNRFNILFYNAAGVYYLRKHMVSFYDDAFGTPNRLHAAVRDDLRKTQYLAACRALGIVDKLITAPLWRILASRTATIASVSTTYTSLHDALLILKDDASPLLDGSARPLKDATITMDKVHQELFTPGETDEETLVILQLLAAAFATFTKRLLHDHLPGGVFHNMTQQEKAETKTVATTNVISERSFAQLDRMKREKPNATVIAMEAMMLFTNNKTAEWLAHQSPDQRHQLFTSAIQGAASHRDLYRQRCQKIRLHHQAVLREKQKKREEKEASQLRMKEELSREISLVGLWRTGDEIAMKLSTLPLVSKKVSVLKTQIKFRRLVLQQQAEKSLFQWSTGGKALTWQELAGNLVRLTGTSLEPGTDVPPP